MINKKIKVPISQMDSKLLDDYSEAKDDLKNSRVFLDISQNDFRRLFLLQAKILLTKKGQIKEFLVDDNNKDVINQLYFYLIGDSEKFIIDKEKNIKGDIYKGIIIAGTLGTGKTLILTTFIKIIEKVSLIFTEKKGFHPMNIKNILKIHSKEISKFLSVNGEESLNLKPLFIDDIGKETKVVNDFGTIKLPIPDLFSLRYELNSWTFGTCNYNKEDLIDFYGETIIDRFKEMFNYLTLSGESRRK